MSTRIQPQHLLQPARLSHLSQRATRHFQPSRSIITNTIPRVPKPTPFVPDVTTFLTLIGRNLSQHADKISSWNDLFSLTTSQFRDLGVEPPRTRKYLLRWLDRFRNGQFGVGGEAKFVKDGKVECRLIEVEKEREGGPKSASKTGMHKLTRNVRRVVNVPYSGIDEDAAGMEGAGQKASTDAQEEATAPSSMPISRKVPPLDPAVLKQATRIEGIRLNPGHGVEGSYIRPVKGTHGAVAILDVTEGMWEHRRGHKVDGGERRKAEVRAKRRAAERKATRA